jgi:hypothetical protein
VSKKTLFLTLLAIVLAPTAFVSAQTLATMSAAIAGQVVIVGTWIVVIMWVVTGILFLTSVGDPAKLKLARNSLFAAIGGTILIILANGAITFVANSFGL